MSRKKYLPTVYNEITTLYGEINTNLKQHRTTTLNNYLTTAQRPPLSLVLNEWMTDTSFVTPRMNWPIYAWLSITFSKLHHMLTIVAPYSFKYAKKNFSQINNEECRDKSVLHILPKTTNKISC